MERMKKALRDGFRAREIFKTRLGRNLIKSQHNIDVSLNPLFIAYFFNGTLRGALKNTLKNTLIKMKSDISSR